MQEQKRNAAGGAENIWFYSVRLSKSYNVLLLIMLVQNLMEEIIKYHINIKPSGINSKIAG